MCSHTDEHGELTAAADIEISSQRPRCDALAPEAQQLGRKEEEEARQGRGEGDGGSAADVGWADCECPSG